MFRTLLCPSSGAHDYNVDYHIGRFVLGLLYVEVRCGLQAGVVSRLQAKACSLDTTPACNPHLTSNVQQPKNETTNVVINIIVVSS